MITNKLGQDRTIRWAGRIGLHLPANGSVIEEGAYPTACRNAAAVQGMEADIAAGYVEVKLITNMHVVKPLGKKGGVQNPAGVQATAETVIPAAIETKPHSPDTAPKGDRFSVVTDDVNPLAPVTRVLPGTSEEEIKRPTTKAIFPEDAGLAEAMDTEAETLSPASDVPGQANAAPAAPAEDAEPVAKETADPAPAKKKQVRRKKQPASK